MTCAKKYDLAKILPHKPPMILIDDILDVNLENDAVTAIFNVKPDKIFFDKKINGVSSLVGLEIMAQTIGCYSYFKMGNGKPVPGLLLGSRLFNNAIECFECGKTYEIWVHKAFMDESLASFDCKIFDNKNEVLSASINVYQCTDETEILNL